MPQLQCSKGHLYIVDSGQSNQCPTCATMDNELTKTRAIYEATPTTSNFSDMGHPPSASKKTVGIYDHLNAEIDPVVGWLACTRGPDKGKDWRLVAGRNSIGRGTEMQVALIGDAAVSREKQALVSYEPRRQVFTLLPGDSRGLVYLNGEEVTTAVTLNAHDCIELGKSALIFVPLVGSQFSWPTENND